MLLPANLKAVLLRFTPMILSGLAGLAVGLAGFYRDRLIAVNFGVGTESDIFFLTLAFPIFAGSVFTSLALSGFMPTYLQARNKTTISLVLGIHTIVGLFLFIAGYFALPLLPELYRESARIFLPIFPLTAISALFVAVIHSHRAYLFANSLPVLPSLAAIVAIYLFAGRGIIAASYGILAGYALFFIVAMTRALLFEGALIPRFSLKPSSDIHTIFRQYGSLIIGVAAMSSNFMIDQLMAAQYGPGQASALVYGSRLTNFVIALVTAAISNIILTEFSHMEARAGRAELRDTSRFYERIFMAAMFCTVAVIFVFSPFLTNFLFGGPQMTAEEIDYIAHIQRLFVLQLPFFVGGMVYVHRLGAAKKNHITTRIALTNFVLNIVLNLLLGHYWGGAGIALSTTIVYFHSYLQLKFYFRRKDA